MSEKRVIGIDGVNFEMSFAPPQVELLVKVCVPNCCKNPVTQFRAASSFHVELLRSIGSNG